MANGAVDVPNQRGPAPPSPSTPWRSSLDLVFSYSRSQAYYADNLETSPSFTERQWRRRPPDQEAGEGDGDRDGDGDEDEDEGEDEDEWEYGEDTIEESIDEEDEEEDDESEERISEDHALFPSWDGAVDGGGGQNAVALRRSPSSTQRLSPRNRNAHSERRGPSLSPPDERHRRLRGDEDWKEEEEEGDEDADGRRGRSRRPSRSQRSPEVSPFSSAARIATASGLGGRAGRNAADRDWETKRKVKDLPLAAMGALDGSALNAEEGEEGSIPFKTPTASKASLSPPSPQEHQHSTTVDPSLLRAEAVTESTPLLKRAKSSNSMSRVGSGRLRRRSSGYSTGGGSSVRSAGGKRGSTVGGPSVGPSLPPRGTSTFGQSLFNCVNALIGVGILSEPLAFAHAGWVGGVLLILGCGALTNYTGKVLARIMSLEPSLRTYADIGSFAFGHKAKIVVSLLFCMELFAVSVALVILFGDSLYAILGVWSPTVFKVIGFFLVLPTVFLPLRWLSVTSIVGIFSTFTLFIVVLVDGIVKPDAPGSLRSPAETSLWPRWSSFPLAFGLIMAGFSSHPVIPSLLRDMREPEKFNKMLDLAYLATTSIYMLMGVIGYFMFGQDVSDEITRDIVRTPGYPRGLTQLAIWLIVINPLAKFALATRPVNTTIELLCGVEPPSTPSSALPIGNRRQKPCTPTGGGGSSFRQRRRASAPSAIVLFASSSGSASPNGLGYSSLVTDGSRFASDLASSDVSRAEAEGLKQEKSSAWKSDKAQAFARTCITVGVTAVIVMTAIAVPGFDRVMAFLGSLLAFASCVIGPLLANLKLFGRQLSWTRWVLDFVILTLSIVAAAVGTAWSFRATS